VRDHGQVASGDVSREDPEASGLAGSLALDDEPAIPASDDGEEAQVSSDWAGDSSSALISDDYGSLQSKMAASGSAREGSSALESRDYRGWACTSEEDTFPESVEALECDSTGAGGRGDALPSGRGDALPSAFPSIPSDLNTQGGLAIPSDRNTLGDLVPRTDADNGLVTAPQEGSLLEGAGAREVKDVKEATWSSLQGQFVGIHGDAMSSRQQLGAGAWKVWHVFVGVVNA